MTTPAHDAVLQRFRWVGGHADVWRLFDDATTFAAVVDELVAVAVGCGATKVAGIESRGFVLGGAVAVRAGLGFAAIRKAAGMFPGEKLTATAEPDYRGNRHVLRLRRDSLAVGDRVLLVDDWAEVGAQGLAAKDLVEECGAVWAGLALVVDQLSAQRRTQLAPVTGIVTADELGPSD